MQLLHLNILLCLLTASRAFLGQHVHRLASPWLHMSTREQPSVQPVRIDVSLGDGYGPVSLDFFPLFERSNFFTVTYEVPFGLNIEKPPKGFPAPLVNKDSSRADGEKKGDVLRATTCWSQGFNAAGATSDILSFAGNIKWRKSVFDVTGAPWDEVVKALVSNTAERSKTVTLVFEREEEGEEGEEGEGEKASQ